MNCYYVIVVIFPTKAIIQRKILLSLSSQFFILTATSNIVLLSQMKEISGLLVIQLSLQPTAFSTFASFLRNSKVDWRKLWRRWVLQKRIQNPVIHLRWSKLRK